MKTIVFGSWAIVLSLIVLSVLILPACGSLYKVKSSDLHQLKSKEENTFLSQESKAESLHSVGSLFQSDSSNHWLWFESSHPFIFYPDKGLEAEAGKLVIGGNRLQSNIIQENTFRLSSANRDSVVYRNLEKAERKLLKETEKRKTKHSSLWWLLLLLPFLCFVEKRRRSKANR
jgi:hypothetical protein